MDIKCRDCPIRGLPAFQQMSRGDIDAMERFKVGEMVAEPGTPILSEGSGAPQLYTVMQGMGLRDKVLPDGRRQVLNFVLPGDFIGLQAGIMQDMTHSVEATTRMKLCIFNRKDLFGLFRQQPERAYALTWLAAMEHSFLGEALTTVGQGSARERLCWAFARLFRRLTALDMNTDGSVPLPYRQQDLADALGLSLVHTNKTLAALRQQDLLDWSMGRLRIPDVAALEDHALMDTVPKVPRPLF